MRVRIPDWSCFASVTFPNISQFEPYFFRPSDPTNSRQITTLARARGVILASHWLARAAEKTNGLSLADKRKSHLCKTAPISYSPSH